MVLSGAEGRARRRRKIRKKRIAMFVFGVLLVITLAVAPVVVGIYAGNKVSQSLEENDTTISREAGKFLSGVISEFKAGAEESKED
jgi:CHASE3 domain sensor protein